MSETPQFEANEPSFHFERTRVIEVDIESDDEPSNFKQSEREFHPVKTSEETQRTLDLQAEDPCPLNVYHDTHLSPIEELTSRDHETISSCVF